MRVGHRLRFAMTSCNLAGSPSRRDGLPRDCRGCLGLTHAGCEIFDLGQFRKAIVPNGLCFSDLPGSLRQPTGAGIRRQAFEAVRGRRMPIKQILRNIFEHRVFTECKVIK